MWALLSEDLSRLLIVDQAVYRCVPARSPQDGCSALAPKPSFARYLRDARIKRGLSVAEVAEQVGVSQASIYYWESDRVRPRDANLSALCKTLKLPIRATREMAAGG